MGIISDSNSDKNTNNGEKIKEETEKFPQSLIIKKTIYLLDLEDFLYLIMIKILIH